MNQYSDTEGRSSTTVFNSDDDFVQPPRYFQEFSDNISNLQNIGNLQPVNTSHYFYVIPLPSDAAQLQKVYSDGIYQYFENTRNEVYLRSSFKKRCWFYQEPANKELIKLAPQENYIFDKSYGQYCGPDFDATDESNIVIAFYNGLQYVFHISEGLSSTLTGNLRVIDSCTSENSDDNSSKVHSKPCHNQLNIELAETETSFIGVTQISPEDVELNDVWIENNIFKGDGEKEHYRKKKESSEKLNKEQLQKEQSFNMHGMENQIPNVKVDNSMRNTPEIVLDNDDSNRLLPTELDIDKKHDDKCVFQVSLKADTLFEILTDTERVDFNNADSQEEKVFKSHCQYNSIKSIVYPSKLLHEQEFPSNKHPLINKDVVLTKDEANNDHSLQKNLQVSGYSKTSKEIVMSSVDSTVNIQQKDDNERYSHAHNASSSSVVLENESHPQSKSSRCDVFDSLEQNEVSHETLQFSVENSPDVFVSNSKDPNIEENDQSSLKHRENPHDSDYTEKNEIFKQYSHHQNDFHGSFVWKGNDEKDVDYDFTDVSKDNSSKHFNGSKSTAHFIWLPSHLGLKSEKQLEIRDRSVSQGNDCQYIPLNIQEQEDSDACSYLTTSIEGSNTAVPLKVNNALYHETVYLDSRETVLKVNENSLQVDSKDDLKPQHLKSNQIIQWETNNISGSFEGVYVVKPQNNSVKDSSSLSNSDLSQQIDHTPEPNSTKEKANSYLKDYDIHSRPDLYGCCMKSEVSGDKLDSGIEKSVIHSNYAPSSYSSTGTVKVETVCPFNNGKTEAIDSFLRESIPSNLTSSILEHQPLYVASSQGEIKALHCEIDYIPKLMNCQQQSNVETPVVTASETLEETIKEAAEQERNSTCKPREIFTVIGGTKDRHIVFTDPLTSIKCNEDFSSDDLYNGGASNCRNDNPTFLSNEKDEHFTPKLNKDETYYQDINSCKQSDQTEFSLSFNERTKLSSSNDAGYKDIELKNLASDSINLSDRHGDLEDQEYFSCKDINTGCEFEVQPINSTDKMLQNNCDIQENQTLSNHESFPNIDILNLSPHDKTKHISRDEIQVRDNMFQPTNYVSNSALEAYGNKSVPHLDAIGKETGINETLTSTLKSISSSFFSKVSHVANSSKRQKVLSCLQAKFKDDYLYQQSWRVNIPFTHDFKIAKASQIFDLHFAFKRFGRVRHEKDIFTFDLDKSVRTILLTGKPLFGKTTFCNLLAYQWCDTKLPISNYKLCIFLKLNQIKFQTDLTDSIIMICNEMLAKDEYGVESIRETLLDVNSKLLILLDGYDEIPVHEQVMVSQFLSSSPIFFSSKVIVTTRPGVKNTFLDRFEGFACLEGFSPERLRMLTKYPVSQRVSSFYRALSREQKLLYLSDLSPLFTLYVSRVANHKDVKEIEVLEKSGLYGLLYQVIDTITKHNFNTVRMALEDVELALDALGKLFFEALVYGYISFEEQLLIENLGPRGFSLFCKCYILYEDRCSKSKVWVASSKIMMVFLATKYLRQLWAKRKTRRNREMFLKDVFCGPDCTGAYIVSDKLTLYFVGTLPEIVVKLGIGFCLEKATIEMIYDVDRIEHSHAFDSVNLLLRLSKDRLGRFGFKEQNPSEINVQEKFRNILSILDLEDCFVESSFYHNEVEQCDFLKINGIDDFNSEAVFYSVFRKNEVESMKMLYVEFSFSKINKIFVFLKTLLSKCFSGFDLNECLKNKGYAEFVFALVCSLMKQKCLRPVTITCGGTLNVNTRKNLSIVSYKIEKKQKSEETVVQIFKPYWTKHKQEIESCSRETFISRRISNLTLIKNSQKESAICIQLL